MLYDLHRYEPGFDMLYDNGNFTCAENLTDNRNMNDRLIALHRGVDNVIRFRVFNSDRKRAKIDHLRIKATLINKENRERVLVVYGDPDCSDGIFKLSIPEGDLVDIPAGFYDLVITGEEFWTPEQPGEIMSTPFYTNATGDIKLSAEVSDSVEKAPLPTVTVLDWTPTSFMVDGILTTLQCSPPIPGSRMRNSKNGLHTFTVSANHFRGKLFAYGSLNHTPPESTNPDTYFPLNIVDSRNFIQFGDSVGGSYDVFSGIEAWTFSANVLWVVFFWCATDDKGVPHPSITPPVIVLDDFSEVPNKLDRLQIRA